MARFSRKVFGGNVAKVVTGGGWVAMMGALMEFEVVVRSSACTARGRDVC